MIKKLFLSVVCILSIAESSFRSQADHVDSIGAATNVSGCGAAVIILVKQPDGMTNILNGTYVAPGKVLTISTEKIVTGEAVVVSSFLSSELSYCIGYSSEGSLNFLQADIEEQLKTNRNGCKIVQGIKYPSNRQRTSLVPVARGLDVGTLPGSLPFITDHDAYIAAAAEAPICAMNFSVAGANYCMLDIDAFPEGHPIATIAADPIAAEAVVNVMGHSIFTHVHDGSHRRTYDETQKIMDLVQLRGAFQGISTKIKIKLPLGATYFSQVGRPLNDKFIVEATCASAKNILPGQRDQIWDPTRTDPRIQAMIVNGLIGSGVYNAEGELVAIVACAHKSLLTGYIEDLFDQTMQKLKNGEDVDYNKFVARKISTSLPQKLHHPLLNIHQIITRGHLESMPEVSESN